MAGPLDGIRVVEVASWTFVPAAGAVLVDWGAEVLKIEHPETGDPQRGLITSGLIPGGPDGVNFIMEQPNHGKKSVGIDLSHPDGRATLLKLVETADVFLTNYMPAVRRKLKIENADILEANPNIIIARGTGQGPRGPHAEKGGYDGASFWARGGMGMAAPPTPDGWPSAQLGPAFGDVMGGLSIAGGIAAALTKRERTGETSVVDVSLLATAMWQLSPMVVASKLFGFGSMPQGDRTQVPNPGVNTYKTSDDRFISLILLQSDKHWASLAEHLDSPELVTDERFATAASRAEHSQACVALMDEAFGAHPLSYWRDKLDTFAGVWAPYQTLDELYEDPQVIENGYLPSMIHGSGQEVQLVASPAQFDETPPEMERCPEHGEHTEMILLDAGIEWDDIAKMKESGAVL